MLVTEYVSCTAPHAVVLAALIPSVGVAPPVLVKGRPTDTDDRAVPPDALVTRP